MPWDSLVDFLIREALQQCARQDISLPRHTIQYIIQWLLASREQDLTRSSDDEKEQIYQNIYDQIIENGPVIRTLKLSYHHQHSTIDIAEVRVKHEDASKKKLAPLLENICGLIGTSKADQDALVRKMIIYIVAVNKMFSTKDTEMLSEAKCALHSIFTTGDLLDFLSHKKHYRIDSMERIGKIMCGILIFNKYTGMGAEAIRDVVSDVHMAYQNTLEAVQYNEIKCKELVSLGLKAVSRTVSINLTENKVIYKLPEGITMSDLELFNKFNYIHLQHEIYIQKLKEPLAKFKNLIDTNVGQLKETLFQLQEVVQFRLAVPTDLVFPQFTKLFETWYQILMQLYFLVEINHINDDMAEIVSTTHYPFEEMATKISSAELTKTYEVDFGNIFKDEFEEELTLRIKRKSDSPFSNPLQRFCSLTMALTNGILVQADTSFGVLQFQNQFWAFKRKDYGAFAEKHFNQLTKYFLQIAQRNPEMCILFDIPVEFVLHGPHIKGAKKRIPKKSNIKQKTCDVGLQYEHCVPPATVVERASYSWNIWDYRKRAIQLANLRKCVTHSTQTHITFHSRDAGVQTYSKTSSTHRCICCSSQLNKSPYH